jgi:hypothetical protein
MTELALNNSFDFEANLTVMRATNDMFGAHLLPVQRMSEAHLCVRASRSVGSCSSAAHGHPQRPVLDA